MLIFNKLVEKSQTVLQAKNSILFENAEHAVIQNTDSSLNALKIFLWKNVLYVNDLVNIIISNEVLDTPCYYL